MDRWNVEGVSPWQNLVLKTDGLEREPGCLDCFDGAAFVANRIRDICNAESLPSVSQRGVESSGRSFNVLSDISWRCWKQFGASAWPCWRCASDWGERLRHRRAVSSLIITNKVLLLAVFAIM